MHVHSPPKTSFLAIFTSFWRNRGLILEMTKREITSRYRGSFMGLAWSFITPVTMLAVYTFVFSVVFKARWGIGSEETRVDFAILLFVGLLLHGLFAECANRSPGLIISNVNYVKKVVFPLEILPWVILGGALFNAGISLFVLMTAQLLLKHNLPWTAILFPLVVLPLLLATIGFSWFLSATGVFMRDIGHTVGILTTVLLFLSAIFYPISALPENYQLLLKLNPLAFIIEESRKVLIFGHLPDWTGLGLALLGGLAMAWGGFWWFQKTRRGFADVL